MRVKLQMSDSAYHDKLKSRGLHPDGSEIVDPKPMAPPVGYIKQPSMIEHIRNMVRSEALRVAALEAGAETFEEADDFDVPDDPIPVSPHEIGDLEPVSVLRERLQAAEKAEAEKAAKPDPAAAAPAAEKAAPAAPPSPASAST